ncbi:MAG: sensor histidine kinase [Deferribacterales bacterium]
MIKKYTEAVIVNLLGSLRFKIVLVFAGFSIILGIALFVGIMLSTKYAEQQTLKKRLELETDRYLKSIVNTPSSPVVFTAEIPMPKSQYMTSYLGDGNLPEWAVKTLTSLPEGNYERDNDKQSYYIAIRALQDGQRFYLLFNTTTLLTDHLFMSTSRKYLMIIVLPVFILGLLLGTITAYKTIYPVVRLSRIIKKWEETGTMPESLTRRFGNDEVGYLANTLEMAITEMQSAINREKVFARDASHELRTPVTVLRNTVKVLSENIGEGDGKNQHLLSRIKRAVSNMEHLISSFLWLSKQERDDIVGSCNVAMVVRESVENNSYLLRMKPLKVTVEEYSPAVLPVASELFYIVVSNIIRNAMTYTNEGHVKISIYGACVCVEDTGPGIPMSVMDNLNRTEGVSASEGFGFGLSIAQRMCVQLNWKMNIISEEGRGTKITICCSDQGQNNYPESREGSGGVGEV